MPREVLVGAPVVTSPGARDGGVEEDEQIDGAVAAIFAVVALKLARLGGNGSRTFADGWVGALVSRPQSLGIGRSA